MFSYGMWLNALFLYVIASSQSYTLWCCFMIKLFTYSVYVKHQHQLAPYLQVVFFVAQQAEQVYYTSTLYICVKKNVIEYLISLVDRSEWRWEKWQVVQNVPCSAVAVATLCCLLERTNFMIHITASYVVNTCLCCVCTHTHTQMMIIKYTHIHDMLVCGCDVMFLVLQLVVCNPDI